ncbi:Uncharacterised protein [Mycobacteroides abscessus subsp. abscessus]|uniref:hypothetical protein n=1 Tax=Mycobacteroides abscessus TaxID=36809 RepID=UPI00092CB6BA|nr:hypothetical protein [Mycobacteroides abscessus]SIA49451.1 Uncharacterised protein [Mycobacteroides abscessus subsp. abscessus]SIA69505.1 Uncharacterised protein [Mycobacteroides abscessus subsp. abscessus]
MSEMSQETHDKIYAAHQAAAKAMLEHLRDVSSGDVGSQGLFQTENPRFLRAVGKSQCPVSPSPVDDLFDVASRQAAEMMAAGRSPGIAIKFGVKPAPVDLYPERHWDEDRMTRFLANLGFQGRLRHQHDDIDGGHRPHSSFPARAGDRKSRLI